MKDAQTGQADPTTADKLWFWMGGSLPSAFSAWVEGQIRSRWFPLRRMGPPSLRPYFGSPFPWSAAGVSRTCSWAPLSQYR